MMIDKTKIDEAAALLQACERPVALTGAGISAESGIPTFRGLDDSLWSRWAPEDLATEHAFRADPALVWGWYVWRMGVVSRAEPNAGHSALAELQRRVPTFAIITQNVDNLHERAGSTRIAHLHGSIFELRCVDCSAPYPDFVIPPDAADDPQLRREPPHCPDCNAHIRPGVVWFGEQMPGEPWDQAVRWLRQCDLLLVIGTSAVVQPAASLAGVARGLGAKVILINPQSTDHAELADIHLQAGAAEVLPLLLELG